MKGVRTEIGDKYKGQEIGDRRPGAQRCRDCNPPSGIFTLSSPSYVCYSLEAVEDYITQPFHCMVVFIRFLGFKRTPIRRVGERKPPTGSDTSFLVTLRNRKLTDGVYQFAEADANVLVMEQRRRREMRIVPFSMQRSRRSSLVFAKVRNAQNCPLQVTPPSLSGSAAPRTLSRFYIGSDLGLPLECDGREGGS
jgi:hypothetical protein